MLPILISDNKNYNKNIRFSLGMFLGEGWNIKMDSVLKYYKKKIVPIFFKSLHGTPCQKVNTRAFVLRAMKL